MHGYTAELSELSFKLANELPKVRELQVRHQWERGDVAMQDNFATAHFGVSADIGNQIRRLYRVSAWSPTVTPCVDRTNLVRERLAAAA